MTNCNYRKRAKTLLCVGGLKKRITILEKSLDGSLAGNLDGEITFTEVLNPFALVETLTGSQLFNGVNISSDITHAFYVKYTDKIKKIDAAGNYYIRYKNSNYRIIKRINDNEDNETIVFLCADRGLAENNGAEGDSQEEPSTSGSWGNEDEGLVFY